MGGFEQKVFPFKMLQGTELSYIQNVTIIDRYEQLVENENQQITIKLDKERHLK